MEDGKTIGRNHIDLGNIVAIHQRVLESGAGIVVTKDTETSDPETWNNLPGMHRRMIREGHIMYMDSTCNVTMQPIPKPLTEGAEQAVSAS